MVTEAEVEMTVHHEESGVDVDLIVGFYWNNEDGQWDFDYVMAQDEHEQGLADSIESQAIWDKVDLSLLGERTDV